MLPVHTAYPLLAVVLWRMARPGDLAKLSKWLVLSAALVLATQALFITSFFNLDGGFFFQFFLNSLNEETAVVDSTDDYLLFSLPNISSLLFTAPWLAAHTLIARKKWAWTAVLFLLSVGGLMLAGRRASLLALLAGVCVAFLAVRVNGHRPTGDIASGAFGKRLALLLVTLTLVGSLAFALGGLNADLLAERATSIFDFSTNESNIVRRLQFDALIDGIAERPLLGQGLGAAAFYTRSDDAPWSYELSYVALAFNFGLLGLLWFSAGVVYVLIELVRLVGRRGVPETERLYIACFLAGLVAFLIANATNPYLAKFDYMWTLFIPLAFIRLYARDAEQNRRKRLR